MGFLKSFGRILSGKPAYEPGDFTQADQPQQTQLPDGQPVAPGSPAPSPPSQGPKVVPVVRITRVECPVNGSRMDIYGDIRNESSVPTDASWIGGSILERPTNACCIPARYCKTYLTVMRTCSSLRPTAIISRPGTRSVCSSSPIRHFASPNFC
jgi:hypothetical protein